MSANKKKEWTHLNYSEQEAAGVKLLAAALQRNALAVSKSVKNSRTRELCFAVHTAAEQMIDAVDYDSPFTVCVLLAPETLSWGDVTPEEGIPQPRFSQEERAGIRKLAIAVTKNAEVVAKRYKNPRTQELVAVVLGTCAAMLRALDDDQPFTICVLQQQALFDWDVTDDGYGAIK